MKKEKNKQKKADKKENNKLVKVKDKPSVLKWLGNIFVTIALFAIIIIIYILINWGAQELNLPDYDYTEEQIYSITQPTIDKLQNLDKDVTINLLNMENNTAVVEFINQYVELNSHITTKQIDDITTRPDLVSLYGLTEDDSVLIFECGDTTKVVTQYDFYTYDSITYDTIDTTEEAITNAILDVTIEDKPKIYFLTGHNNYSDDGFLYFQADLLQESNDVETLNIITNTGIPEDCDLLVITTLAEDLEEFESNAIIEYIQNGGEILLLADPNYNNVELPNFQKVLDEYGITIGNGIIIETETNSMIAGLPNFIINTVTENSSITQNVGMNINACLINAGKIEFADSDKMEELGVSVEYLTSASSNAFYRTNLEVTSTEKTDEDEDLDSAYTGAALNKKIDDDTESKLIVFSNCLFATDSEVTITQGYTTYAYLLSNNSDILLNSVSYLTEREDNITIRKSMDYVAYTVTEEQHRIILTIIFAVPIFMILVGIIVWQARRRKK